MATAPDTVTAETPRPDGRAEKASRRRFLGVMDVGVLLGAMLVFLLFLYLLSRALFPEGSRLAGDDLLRGGSAAMNSERGEVSLATSAIENFGDFIAQLADVRRKVKIRSADSLVWTDANEGIPVHNRDALQTFTSSRARIDFTTENKLRIGQNSLVIFRTGAADPFLARREPAVVLMEGELTGEVNADFGEFPVELPAGLIVLKSEKGGDEVVDFKASVNSDKSSTIVVYTGEANINVAGEHFVVSANKGLTIGADGTTSGVSTLPQRPAIRAPRNGTVERFRDIPPRVNFQWRNVAGAQNYRVEIAKDPEFDDILVDEYRDDASFTHANLAPGAYYWRVSARNGWVQGPASKARRLRVVRDTKPPTLELEPIQRQVAGRYRLRGKTSSGATVYIRGNEVATSAQGIFEYDFDAEPGAQTIVVEAVDDVGNVAYRSEILYAQNAPRRSN